MGNVVSFEEQTPPARHDDVAWSEVRVQEAPAFGGPWTQIEVLELDPVDDDPSDPQERSFTSTEAGDIVGLWYRAVWADADGNVSAPTDPFQENPDFDEWNLYLTAEELKASLAITGTEVADEDIRRALPAASRAIDGLTGRFFYLTGDDSNGEVRKYTRLRNPRRLDVDDIVALANVDVDWNGDGVYETSLVLGTDYVLEPANAPLSGAPYEEILLRRRTWPAGPQAIRLTGRFGWAAVPPGVVEATSILAARLVKVIRDATFGVYVSVGLDTAAAIRLGRTDPHVMMAIKDVTKTATSG